MSNVIHIDAWLNDKYLKHKEACLACLNLARMSTDVGDINLSKALTNEAREQAKKSKEYKSLRDSRRNTLSKSKYKVIYSVAFEIPSWA